MRIKPKSIRTKIIWNFLLITHLGERAEHRGCWWGDGSHRPCGVQSAPFMLGHAVWLGCKALGGTLGSWVLEELILRAGQRTQLPHYYASVYAEEIKEEGHYPRAMLIQKDVLPLWMQERSRTAKFGFMSGKPDALQCAKFSWKSNS